MRAAAVIALFILIYSNSIAGIKIETLPEKIAVTINNPEPGLTYNEESKEAHLAILNTTYSSMAPAGEANTDEIRIAVAVPEELYYSSDINKYIIVRFQDRTAIDSKYNTVFKGNSAGNYCRLERNGIVRGIHSAFIVVNPFAYDKAEDKAYIYNDITVEVSLPFKLPLNINPRSKEAFMFSAFANREHIGALIEQRNNSKKRSDRPQGGEYWYKPGGEYVKVTTTKDGIASVKAADIIAANGNFQSKPTGKLVMLHRGEEIPVYFSNDADGILNAGDEIIFSGSRAFSDTTWYDHYTDKEPYYIYFDDNAVPKRYSQFPQDGSTPVNIEYVEVDRHIEYNKTHFWGFDLHNPYCVDTEGWYWKEIDSKTDNRYRDSALFIVPYKNEPLNLGVRLGSIKVNDSIDYQTLSLYLNNSLLSHKNYELRVWHTETNAVTNTSLVAGYNSVTMINHPFLDSANEPFEPNSVSIDYLTITGKVLPVTDTGLISFRVNSPAAPGNLTVSNFRDSEVFVIDSRNGYINPAPAVKKGTNIIAGVNSANGYASLVIDNNKVTDAYRKGFHCAALAAPGFGAAEYRFFDANSQEMATWLSGLPNGSIVALVYNSDAVPPADKATLLSSYGSTQIGQANGTQPWFFTFTKGTQGLINEKTGNSSTLSAAVFYEHAGGSSFNINQLLAAGKDYDITACDRKSIETAAVFPVTSSDLRNTDNQADLLYIYHKKFRRFTDSLTQYRAKTHPQYTIKIVEIDDIYKEFYNGRKSAHAVKEFLMYAYNNWKSVPLYVTIIGDATTDPLKILPSTCNEDFVPSWGSPHSDYWYSLLDGKENDYNPELIVARIPVNDDEECFNYYSKLLDYESTPTNLWMKKFLMLTGGYLSEKETLYAYMQWFGSNLVSSGMCIDTSYVRKKGDDLTGESEALQIITQVDEGVGWTMFFGHGSQRIFDMDGWAVDLLHNKGRLGILSTFSCNTGAFGSADIRTRNEDYLFYPNTGYVAASGASATSHSLVLFEYIKQISKLLLDSTGNKRTIGELIQLSKITMINYLDVGFKHKLEYQLIGDPLIKLRIPFESDVYTYGSDLTITNPQKKTIIIESDSLALVNGIAKSQKSYPIHDQVKALLIHTFNNKSDSLVYNVDGLCKSDYYSFEIDIKDKPGIHNVTIILDPDSALDDPDRSNNIINASFEVFNGVLLSLEPMKYWDKEKENPVFRIINPLDDGSGLQFDYEFKIAEDSVNGTVIINSGASDIKNYENYIEWKPDVELQQGMNYYFLARSVNKSNSTTSAWLQVPFWANPGHNRTKAQCRLNGDNLLNGLVLDNMMARNVGGKAAVTLSYRDIPYKVMSVRGAYDFVNKRDSIPPGFLFEYDGKLAATSHDIKYPMSSIVAMVISESDYKLKEGLLPCWYTWDTLSTWDHPELTLKDSASINFMHFVRDSVKDNEYLFLAFYQEALCIPINHNPYHTIGSLDTIKAELKNNFGSKYADSLIWGCSFAMVSKRGNTEANEGFSIIHRDTEEHDGGDTVIVEGQFRHSQLSGSATTGTIGNAKKWNSLSVQGYLPSDSVSFKVLIYGYPKNGGNDVLLISDSVTAIDLSAIDAVKYPRINAVFEVKRYSKETEPYIDGIFIDYVPAPELALVNSKLSCSPVDVMRAENVTINGTAENISLRSPAVTPYFSVALKSDDGTAIDFFNESYTPDYDSDKDFSFIKETDYYRNINIVNYNVNDGDSVVEQYSFNNTGSSSFRVAEDKVAPTVEVYFDGILLKDGDFVSKKPKVDVRLFDNSKLLVQNKEDLKVLINYKYNEIVNLPDYQFTSYTREMTPEKARVTFTVDELEYSNSESKLNTNIIYVWFTDGSGNRDSVEISFYALINGYLDTKTSPFVVPNPLSNSASFEFLYKGPSNGAVGRILIYNLTGQKIIELRKNIVIGENTIEWDGKDPGGSDLPSGTYYFVLFVDTNVWVQEAYGKFIILR